jgi:hypothetical protein
MKSNNFLFMLLTAVIITSLTGCYTQVATTDPEPYSTTTIYKQSTESSDYYSEDGELLDSSYYSEIDSETGESVTIINEYNSDYPYGYYDSYPYISFGFGLSWGCGWGGYYSYWPYYSGWWGGGWYYPSYCYYPSYYYYNPYYCDPYYGGYYPYYGYGYGYGYDPRNEYVTRIRNNSGGRNNPELQRDAIVTSTNGSINRGRDDLNLGRDLTADRINAGDRSSDIQNRTGDLTREVVGLKDGERITNTKRNDIASNELSRTTDITHDKQLGLDREVTTKKSLGINNRNDVSRKNVRSSNTGNVSENINKNNRIGNETKKIFGKENTNRTNNKENVRTKNNTRQQNVKNNPNSNQTPRKDNNTRSYTPKQNNNSPRTYSQPRNNNNTPRSYSPPSGNNSPRSYSPPSGNSGSNNSGNRRR